MQHTAIPIEHCLQHCRTPEVLEFARPNIPDAFSGAGPAWQPDNILRLYHQVERSFIRVDADEVTYPLHVILRFRQEKALADGSLAVRDLPDAWNSGFKSLIGIDVADDARGCLQDIHWYGGSLGYFPTYTLGAMTAAQVYQSAKTAHPSIPDDITKGDFSTLVGWLRKHIHASGRFAVRAGTADQGNRKFTAGGTVQGTPESPLPAGLSSRHSI